VFSRRRPPGGQRVYAQSTPSVRWGFLAGAGHKRPLPRNPGMIRAAALGVIASVHREPETSITRER
jgi:hypothetical protein